jgi:AcrR family transcriptional regulator
LRQIKYRGQDKDIVPKKRTDSCKRPYTLGRRQELSDHKRATILAAARKQLESAGYPRFTMETLATESGVTRQTVHNLFGTKTALLEALFDHIALDAGMERMRSVMQQTHPELLLSGLVGVFSDFWTKYRFLLRRIHGIAAIDPEFGAAVAARNRRRQGAVTRVVDRLESQQPQWNVELRARRIGALYAMTSFEFFDALAESIGTEKDIPELLSTLVGAALESQLQATSLREGGRAPRPPMS